MSNDINTINKSDATYPEANAAKRLTFFSSFDEEREAQYAYWRSLTPQERFEEHRKLTLQLYSGYEKYTGNRLIFD